MSASNVVKLEVKQHKAAPAIQLPKRGVSDTWLRNLKSDTRQRVYLADNLDLELRDNDRKYWNVRYTLNGKRGVVRVGSYPKVSFAEAKAERDEIQMNAAAGICPKSTRFQKRKSLEPRLRSLSAPRSKRSQPSGTRSVAIRGHQRLATQLSNVWKIMSIRLRFVAKRSLVICQSTNLRSKMC